MPIAASHPAMPQWYLVPDKSMLFRFIVKQKASWWLEDVLENPNSYSDIALKDQLEKYFNKVYVL